MGYSSKNDFRKCCPVKKKAAKCHLADSFKLHRKVIKPVCGRCIPAVTGSCAWGAATACYDPSCGPYGVVRFTGVAHNLTGPAFTGPLPGVTPCEYAFDNVTIRVHQLGRCDPQAWCTFRIAECGKDLDDCGNDKGWWVTFDHACVVPSKEILEDLTCGRALLSVVTDPPLLGEEPVTADYPSDCGDNFGGIWGEARGIVCIQEKCYPDLYKDVPCCDRPKPDTCIPHTDLSSSCSSHGKGGGKRSHHKKSYDAGSSWW